MHIDPVALCLKNTLVFLLLTLVAVTHTGDCSLLRQMLKIWKMLRTPLLLKEPAKTNHKSDKFLEIDLTKFKP